MMRIEALGERMVTSAGLDPGEFDFASPPPQGGPLEPRDLDGPNRMPDLLDSLDQLARQLEDRFTQLEALDAVLIGRKLSREVIPEGQPVRSGYVTSGFGARKDPYTGRRARHEGVDFAGKKGADILAVASGIVTWSGTKAGYGRLVELGHGNGYVTRYAHNSQNLVEVGETVRKGERIALMGSSGRSTGPHLHFEVLHDDEPVNPEQFIDVD
jgi:murein DD-endopeptidase MepM/ murein hydrolase activator NlpD